jgi:hypothetical protein
MRKIIVGLLLIMGSSELVAQITISNFSEKKVCWLGVDFSLAKFIGAHGFTEPDQIKSHYFDEWNYLVIREPERYKIKSAFDLEDLTYYVDHLIGIHQQIDMSVFIQEKSHSITESEIQAAFSKYDLSAVKDEVGISFFVETFNKNLEEAQIWVVLSDLQTKTIFFSRKLKGAPQGFGFRNYWAGAIREVTEICESSLKKWKKGK